MINKRTLIWLAIALLVSCGGDDNPLNSDGRLSWTPRESGFDNWVFDVTWSGTQFIAVGANGVILSSPDGISWSSRDSGTPKGLLSVIWTGDQFIAVGYGVNNENVIVTSPDGNEWTVRESGYPRWLTDVCATDSMIVAVGGHSGPIILTSSDAEHWNRQHAGDDIDSVYDWFGVTASTNLFVAVGRTFRPEGGSAVISSSDAVSWTLRAEVDTVLLKKIAWSGNEFVAVGHKGGVVTSPDGITWGNHSLGDSVYFEDVMWDGSRFVATCGGCILQSVDGEEWTALSDPQGQMLASIAFSGERYVAVGEMGTVLTSP